ncbi:MAG: hypothetical protein C4293_03180 [Nitrospiraceae bacterium]
MPLALAVSAQSSSALQLPKADGAVVPKDLFKSWHFDAQPAGEVPVGFSPYAFGTSQAAIWMVQRDVGAPSKPNVLMQAAPCLIEGCFQLLLADELIYEYPDVAVQLRLTGEPGVSTGGGGVAFGAKDAHNFYAAIADTGADTVELVRVVDGNATVLDRASVKRRVGWHHLRVQRNTTISKEYIEVAFDGMIVLSYEEKTLGPGRVGLVTRGPATVAFDNFHAAPLYSQKPLSPPAAY